MAAMAMVSKQLNKPCIIVVNDKKSNVGKVCNDLKGLLGSFDIDVHWMGAAASWDALSQSQLLQRSFATGGVVPVLQCYYTELTRLNTYVREQGIVGKDLFAFTFGVQACSFATCSMFCLNARQVAHVRHVCNSRQPGANVLVLSQGAQHAFLEYNSPSTLQSVCQALRSYL